MPDWDGLCGGGSEGSDREPLGPITSLAARRRQGELRSTGREGVRVVDEQ